MYFNRYLTTTFLLIFCNNLHIFFAFTFKRIFKFFAASMTDIKYWTLEDLRAVLVVGQNTKYKIVENRSILYFVRDKSGENYKKRYQIGFVSWTSWQIWKWLLLSFGDHNRRETTKYKILNRISARFFIFYFVAHKDRPNKNKIFFMNSNFGNFTC